MSEALSIAYLDISFGTSPMGTSKIVVTKLNSIFTMYVSLK